MAQVMEYMPCCVKSWVWSLAQDVCQIWNRPLSTNIINSNANNQIPYFISTPKAYSQRYGIFLGPILHMKKPRWTWRDEVPFQHILGLAYRASGPGRHGGSLQALSFSYACCAWGLAGAEVNDWEGDRQVCSDQLWLLRLPLWLGWQRDPQGWYWLVSWWSEVPFMLWVLYFLFLMSFPYGRWIVKSPFYK